MSRLFDRDQLVVVSGPSLADELSRRVAKLAIASSNPDLAHYIADIVTNGNIGTHVSDDSTGIEWAGIAKNVATLDFTLGAKP